MKFKKILSDLILLNAILILLFSLVVATDDIDFDDDYTIDGSTSDDAFAFQNEYLDVEIVPDNTIDVECWDWSNDNNWEHCFARSSQALSDCRSASSWLDNLCDTEAECVGSGVGEHVMETDVTVYHDIDARYYYKCDSSYQWVDFTASNYPYYIINPKKFDCDGCDWYTESCPDYDLEGDYNSAGTTWKDIKANIDCVGDKVCDENHDDNEISSMSTYIPDPCRLDLGDSCSTDDECASDICNDDWDWCGDCEDDNDCTDPDLPSCYYAICNCVDYPSQCDSCVDYANGYSCDCDGECESNNCVSGTCYPATETSCTDSSDNDMDGSTDCDDSDCEGETGPNGKICCNDGAYDCGTCKYCSNDECENRPTTYECNSNYKCSDSSKGDNAYDASDYKSPSKGYCDGNGNCDYVPNDAPTCDLAEGTSQEEENYDICQDGYSSCRDTCSDGIDNDNDRYTDEDDTDCPGGNPCDNDYNCESGETPGNCPNDCVSEGNTCSYDEQCYDVDYCVHNICRDDDPYCTDGYCDYGETCSSCESDCGSCGGPEIDIGPLSLTFYI
jgi:hypothetical protein